VNNYHHQQQAQEQQHRSLQPPTYLQYQQQRLIQQRQQQQQQEQIYENVVSQYRMRMCYHNDYENDEQIQRFYWEQCYKRNDTDTTAYYYCEYVRIHLGLFIRKYLSVPSIDIACVSSSEDRNCAPLFAKLHARFLESASQNFITKPLKL